MTKGILTRRVPSCPSIYNLMTKSILTRRVPSCPSIYNQTEQTRSTTLTLTRAGLRCQGHIQTNIQNRPIA